MSYPKTGAYNSTEEVLAHSRRKEKRERLALERLARKGVGETRRRVTPQELDKAFEGIPNY